MTVDRIPVHEGLAKADVRYSELEVEPWPHIHVWRDEDESADRPVVKVRLVRYEGWPIWVGDRESRDEVARWTRTVRPPGPLARLLGRVTLEQRIAAAIEVLEDQWDDLRAVTDRVEAAAASYRIHDR